MHNKQKTLNDNAWEKLFEKHSILESISRKGTHVISAKEINEFREARLMTKLDHRKNLPIPFKEHNLSILPISRGSYVVGNFDAYHKLETTTSETKKVKIPEHIQSIDANNITSEATAINIAFLSGILSDFIGEDEICPTVNGRMSSEIFDFNIYNNVLEQKQTISVKKSQLEIDGGFEGYNSLVLIEAKNSLSDDFIVRQLYYPFRLWQSKIEKPVKSVFLIYSNGIFNLYEYEFQTVFDYNSLILRKQQNYTLEEDETHLNEIISLLDRINLTSEPGNIPFPQADSFKRIVNMCELLNESEGLTRNEITSNYDFDIRQTNYYTDACRYLGLLKKERDPTESLKYSLTDEGKRIIELNLKHRNLYFTKLILEKEAFNKTFREYLVSSEPPTKDKIVSILERLPTSKKMSGTTLERRASTVSGWINWILDLCR